MDPDIKQAFKVLGDKLDTYIKHQEEMIRLRLKPIDEHVKDGPHFRDKMVKLCESLRINWVLTLMMVGGCIGGFWWLIRK